MGDGGVGGGGFCDCLECSSAWVQTWAAWGGSGGRGWALKVFQRSSFFEVRKKLRSDFLFFSGECPVAHVVIGLQPSAQLLAHHCARSCALLLVFHRFSVKKSESMAAKP
jgi:hypothetical protein